jgi:hypothetical protein
VALKELVDAKINHLPVPQDEGEQPRRGNVVNLMDALRKSLGSAAAPVRTFYEEAGGKRETRTEEGNWSRQISREVCSEAKVGLAPHLIGTLAHMPHTTQPHRDVWGQAQQSGERSSKCLFENGRLFSSTDTSLSPSLLTALIILGFGPSPMAVKLLSQSGWR